MMRSIHLRKIVWLMLFSLIFCFGSEGGEDLSSQRSAEEYYTLGIMHGKQGNYAEAITALENALAIQPAYADAYNALAVVYHRQGQHEQALQQYLLAIEADPRHIKARTNLAMLYKEEERYDKALQQLERVMQVEPGYAPAQKLLDTVQQKKSDQAAQELQRRQQAAERSSQQTVHSVAATSSSASARTLFAEGTRLIRKGRLAAGIDNYEQGIRRQPRSAEGHTLLGMAYRLSYYVTRDAGWRQRELLAFKNALAANAAYVPALLSLGETLYEQGQILKARSYFQQALQHEPEHPAREQLDALIHYLQ